MAKATANNSAPAASAPASQRVNTAASTGATIERDEELTNDLLAELGGDDDLPERPANEAEGTDEEAAEESDGSTEGEETDEAAEGEESEEAGEEGAEESEESEEEAEGEPKVPKGLQKRFGELTDKIKTQDAEIVRLKQAAAASPARAASSFDEAVQLAGSPEELNAVQINLERWEEFATTHPEGIEIPGQNGAEPTVYTAEQMRGILVQTRRALRAIPTQERFLDQVKAKDAEALKAFPAYRDADSPVSKAYAAIVERAPALARALPDLKLFVADALRGRAIRTKGAGQPQLPGKPVVKRDLPPPGGRGAPVRGAAPRGRDATYQARLAKAEESGSEDDLAAAMEARL